MKQIFIFIIAFLLLFEWISAYFIGGLFGVVSWWGIIGGSILGVILSFICFITFLLKLVRPKKVSIISHLSKVDIYQIMWSLGHEKIETTMIYLEKVFEKEKHAIHSWNSDIFGRYI